MIADDLELREARRRLDILEAALDALRRPLEAENSALLPSATSGYVHQIGTLQELIAAYEDTRTAPGRR